MLLEEREVPAQTASEDNGSGLLIGIIAAVLVLAAIGTGAGLWWFKKGKGRDPLPQALQPIPPAVAECSTPGCSRESYDGKLGSTCCRTCAGSNGSMHGAVCEQRCGGGIGVTTAQISRLPERYVAATNQIRLGQPVDAAHGLATLLGISDAQLGNFLQNPEQAISREFRVNGSTRDQENLTRILAGTYLDSNGDAKTLDELVQHPHAQAAKLQRHHVLALRLYTTESYPRINDPLRQTPPQRPHPFAATTYFISEGIKKQRAVAAMGPDANIEKTYWRGMKDLGIKNEFRQKGGTEFACVSTTADKDVAVHQFAASALPLVFRIISKNFMSRGADVSFLSVMPHEQEFLYPPLTFLHCTDMKMENLCGLDLPVATVEPNIA